MLTRVLYVTLKKSTKYKGWSNYSKTMVRLKTSFEFYFAVMNFILQWRILFCSDEFYFAVIYIAVTNFILAWQSWVTYPASRGPFDPRASIFLEKVSLPHDHPDLGRSLPCSQGIYIYAILTQETAKLWSSNSPASHKYASLWVSD